MCLCDRQLAFILISIFIRVLVGTVRDKGICPCPRCFVLKSEIDKVGQKLDARYRITQARAYIGDLIASARNFIYKLGYGVGSAAVERLLKKQSWVPTRVGASFDAGGFLLTPNSLSRTHLQRPWDHSVSIIS